MDRGPAHKARMPYPYQPCPSPKAKPIHRGDDHAVPDRRPTPPTHPAGLIHASFSCSVHEMVKMASERIGYNNDATVLATHGSARTHPRAALPSREECVVVALFGTCGER